MEDSQGKLLAGVIGAGLIAAGVWFGAAELRDYRAFSDAPLVCDAAAASDMSSGGRRWVTVENAPWRCSDLVTGIDGGRAFLPATADNGAVIVARFDRNIDCAHEAQESLTGVIEPMDAKRAADLRRGGLVIPGGAPLRTLSVCGAGCGKDNARLGILVCSAMVLLAFALYPLRVRWFAARQALRGAVHAPPREAEHANRTVRLWGAFMVVLCPIAAFYCGGWVAYGFIPVRLICAIGMVLGAWMAISPESYRRFASRYKR